MNDFNYNSWYVEFNHILVHILYIVHCIINFQAKKIMVLELFAHYNIILKTKKTLDVQKKHRMDNGSRQEPTVACLCE